MKKLILKSDIKALESCLDKLVFLQRKIEDRLGLDDAWTQELASEASEDLRGLAQAFDSAHFWMGEFWVQSSVMNKNGTSKEDWEHLNQFKKSNLNH